MKPLPSRMAAKRSIDIALILLFSPFIAVLLLGAAIAVRVTIGSPVLFRQKRIGLDERPFVVLKFRTMSNERSEDGELLPDKERLTSTGRVLRKLSIDELPQLINVVRGEMSLVGPRPLLLAYLPYYRSRERFRHAVRPGITGAAQVSGRNGVLWDDRLRIDADYAQSGTLLDDARIIVKTVRGVFVSEGVSVVAGDSGERLDVVRSYPHDDTYALRRLEVADAEICLHWTGSLFGDSTVTSTKIPDSRAWVMASRLSSGRRHFVVAESASGLARVAIEVNRQVDSLLVELKLVIDPSVEDERVEQTAVRFAIEWLRDQDGVLGCWVAMGSRDASQVSMYEQLGFRRPENMQDQSRLVLLWGKISD